ncbi:phage minor head protein [Burkholderia territorii]|uniref:phage head morphogenesis protein n=1 Tax=Burkholderia territorii TaxID=1503055 RepID=UPI000A4B459F|nr:phage minor head protein [Burkholderia territorii]
MTQRGLVSPTGKDILLRPIRPNAGLEARYQRELDKWVGAMHKSLVYWITAQFRANPPPLLAQDAARGSVRDGSSARAMRTVIDRLSKKWAKEFAKCADRLAKHFVERSLENTDLQLRDALSKAGFTVQFKATPAVNNAMQASVGENVGLIKSIARQHLSEVEGLVMRAMLQGRNLKTLTDELETRYSVTRRRASFIARDQANKMTSVINRTRQQELGITQARWRHSHAGKHPRESHVEASREDGGKGKLYDVAKGCLIDGEYIWPGQLPNCRCTGQAVIPGRQD